MAGHSKWANIQHRKNAQDAKRGKLFTKLIREVSVAARLGGPDPAANSRLRLAMDKALSGKLMRTTYTPKWKKLYSESKKAHVYFPKEMRIYDEVEKGNSTIIVMSETDLRPLSKNIFTKAWLESKSR